MNLSTLCTQQQEALLMNGINECYYSEGDKHECCTHQQYCIFNSKRVELERQIMVLSDELHHHKQQLDNIRSGECYTNADYKDTKKKIRILKMDLRQLRLFQLKAINGEIDGYGVQSN